MTSGARINSRIGNWRLVEFLGAGGMGEVYRGLDSTGSNQVAVKLLTAVAGNTTLRARFRNEARIHARLAHPNIAKMIDYLEDDGTPAIVMEYVDGETLEQRIVRDGPMPVRTAVGHAIDLLDAVAYLHRRNIIHRDIKSTNVKVSGDGVIKLLDFGIAKAPDSPALTADGSVIGTLQSLAPEQLAGSPADLQTEIWALGIQLYEMVAGEHPFAADGVDRITARIRSGRYPAPSRSVPGLPAEIDMIIGHCLRVDPRRRYPTCQAMRRDLARLLTPASAATNEPSQAISAWFANARAAVVGFGRAIPDHLIRWRSPTLNGTARDRFNIRARLPLLGALVATALAAGFLVDSLTHHDSPPAPVKPVAPATVIGTVPVVVESDSSDTLRRIVTINTLNGSAEVWRDGSRVGSTPYRLAASIGEAVDLILKREGFADVLVRFDVTEGRSEYSYVLQRVGQRPTSNLPPHRSFPPLLLGMGLFSFPWRRRRNAGNRPIDPTIDMPIAVGRALAADSRVVVGIASNPGCVRNNNEDCVKVVRPSSDDGGNFGLLAIVCDGMGGHAAGETASRIATEVVARDYADGDDPGISLASAIANANRAVHEAAQNDHALAGMGTTCTALALRGGMAWCAHVGDSRCYLVRDGGIFLMTEDHSAVMELIRDGSISRTEARNHPDKNVITRALGSHADVEVSTWPRPFVVRPGDRFLLSTDGLHDVVGEELILEAARRGSPDVACAELVELALMRGAPDNVSMILLAVPANDATRPHDTRPSTAAE